MYTFLLFIVGCCVCHTLANVEKIIFKAPDQTLISTDAAIDNLLLLRIHPNNLSIRTNLNASFPTEDKPHGEDTWVILEGLRPNQRYELRACWLATQPTAFWLDIFTLPEAFDAPELISSLSSYAYARRDQLSGDDVDQLLATRFLSTNDAADTSLLLLRVQAAADYHTLNEDLMKHVPPVHTDLILDPYLLGIFPQSLLPTGGYVAVVAVFAFFLSVWISRKFKTYLSDSQGKTIVQDTKKSK